MTAHPGVPQLKQGVVNAQLHQPVCQISHCFIVSEICLLNPTLWLVPHNAEQIALCAALHNNAKVWLVDCSGADDDSFGCERSLRELGTVSQNHARHFKQERL